MSLSFHNASSELLLHECSPFGTDHASFAIGFQFDNRPEPTLTDVLVEDRMKSTTVVVAIKCSFQVITER